jgi:hypothetical protein
MPDVRERTPGRSGQAGPAWWSTGVRMLQFNWSREELDHLDVDQLVMVTQRAGADTVVVNGGGIYAWYPTDVSYHYADSQARELDPLGRCVEACKAAGIRVVPRIDFSRNAAGALDDHPDWFARDAEGRVHSFQGTASTCPSSPYRNTEYAELVLREIATRYDIAGFHLNAGGFRNYCYCVHCQAAFAAAHDAAIPAVRDWDDLSWLRFVEWRKHAVRVHIDFLHSVIRSLGSELVFTGELMGPGRPAQLSAMCPRALSHSFSTLLTTTGEAVPRPLADRSPWWVGMSAKCVRGYRSDVQPLMNLKASMREEGWPRVAVEPAEYRFQIWQAVANGAGLKLPVLGALDPADEHTLPAIAAGYAAVAVRDPAGPPRRPVADVALVWPLATASLYGRDDAEGRAWSHFYGAYEGLVRAHVPFAVLDEQGLVEEDLSQYGALVLPNVAVLSAEQRGALERFVAAGGGLVTSFETGRYDSDDPRKPGPFLDALLGVHRGHSLPVDGGTGYGRVEDHALTSGLGIEFVPQRGEVVDSTPAAGTAVAVTFAESRDLGGSSERYEPPLHTDRALLTTRTFGAGRVVHFAGVAHRLYWTHPHETSADLIAAALRWARADARCLQTNAAPSVEITLESSADTLAVHFVNANRPGDAVATGSGVEVVLDRRRLRSPVSTAGRLSASTVSGGPVTVTVVPDTSEIRLCLPRIAEFETVRLRADGAT